MKVMTILGTRPEIIRLSRVIDKLDRMCEHVMIHTGQNYDYRLNELFLQQLQVRDPDYFLGAKGGFGEQVGTIMAETERLILQEKPDKFLVLGDTNSALGAVIAKKQGIPVYHMEAGNRCYDDRVPEEVNRRIIDHCSDVLLPYTERSRLNLLREGFPGERVYVTGNPINEVIQHYEPQIRQSTILSELGLEKGKYFLVTMHRAENVDVESRLVGLMTSLDRLQKEYQVPVIASAHPHTVARFETFGVNIDNEAVRFLPPFGFFEFITLERNAMCVLSDSGTLQEECSIFGVPNVTIRDVTERPETLEAGTNILSGADPDSVMLCVRTVLEMKPRWVAPPEYLAEDVSDTVIRIVFGYHHNSMRLEQRWQPGV